MPLISGICRSVIIRSGCQSLKCFERRDAVSRGANVIPVGLKARPQNARDLRLVIDYQNFSGFDHLFIIDRDGDYYPGSAAVLTILDMYPPLCDSTIPRAMVKPKPNPLPATFPGGETFQTPFHAYFRNSGALVRYAYLNILALANGYHGYRRACGRIFRSIIEQCKNYLGQRFVSIPAERQIIFQIDIYRRGF